VPEEPDYEIHEESKAAPEVCQICSKPPVKPVTTKYTFVQRVRSCEHLFCETCALRHYGKSGKCYICKAETNGIFNHVKAAPAPKPAPDDKPAHDPSDTATEATQLENACKEYKQSKQDIKKKTYAPIAGWVIP
jgi:hypothetical protein